MIVNGLSWWQAWICVWIGYSVTGIFVAINARPGAVYHISFPVINRSSFGIWGALWPVLNRAAMGMSQLLSRSYNASLTVNSLCLVWSSSLHWWKLCLPYDPIHLEIMGKRPQHVQ
jgi:cytosine/uracil/thiamine/allantoin permease